MSIATNAIENLLLAAEKEMIRLEQVPRRDREAIFKLSLRMQALEEAQAAVAAAKATLRTREGWAKATQHDDNDEVQGANPKRVEFFKPYLCEGVTAEVWVDEGSDDDDDQEAARTDR
jgi:hypothetical protein